MPAAGKNARGGQKCPRRAKMPAAGKNARSSGQKRPIFLAPDFFFGHFLVPPGASAR